MLYSDFVFLYVPQVSCLDMLHFMTEFSLFYSIQFSSVLCVIRIGYSGSLLKFLNKQMGFGAYSLNFSFHAGCHHNSRASVHAPPIRNPFYERCSSCTWELIVNEFFDH